jgi:thiamine-phosphate pyrophosphorylase
VSRRRARAARAAVEPADHGPWLDPAEAGSKLLLFGRQSLEGLEPLLGSGAVAALVLPAAEIDGAVTDACRRHRLPLLLRGDAATVRSGAADGVHLAKPEQVAAARAQLGREGLIGVSCGLSRHAAMVAGEAGADYVLFGALDVDPSPEVEGLVGWWSELFVLPCAAAGRYSPDTARAMAACGADFLATHDATIELARALVTIGTT